MNSWKQTKIIYFLLKQMSLAYSFIMLDDTYIFLVQQTYTSEF